MRLLIKLAVYSTGRSSSTLKVQKRFLTVPSIEGAVVHRRRQYEKGTNPDKAPATSIFIIIQKGYLAI